MQDFQLAQEIPMIASSVIEFKVIFPCCSSKISALATHQFSFPCQQESFCHNLVGLISFMSSLLPDPSLSGGQTTPHRGQAFAKQFQEYTHSCIAQHSPSVVSPTDCTNVPRHLDEIF